ncbi:hypothetical protein ACHAXR_007655, partial [Thalassiosira sp. AJA248-18]
VTNARKKGGIGAKGSATARFFHPSQNILEQWPNVYKTLRLQEVLVGGKGTHRVNRKDQDCYECRISEIDNSTIFHICSNNFKVEVEGATPFEDEAVRLQEGSAKRPCELTADGADVTPNVTFGSNSALAEQVAELREQGITVDEDNEPAPKNAAPPATTTANVGQWVTPSTCPRRSDPNINNRKGNWKTKSSIKEMDELALFRMCFPEKWVLEAVIPATNKEIEGGPLTLQGFYVHLGCHFFMACFEGISDRRLWWSSKPISIKEGAPFRLNEYMSLVIICSVGSARLLMLRCHYFRVIVEPVSMATSSMWFTDEVV